MSKEKEKVTLDSLSKGWKGYRIPDVGDYPYPHSHPFFRIHGHGPKDDGWKDYRIPVWRRLKIPDKWFAVPSMARTILRFWCGCEMGRFKIIDRDQPGKPVPIRLRTGQQMVLRMMFEQAMEQKPIRILVPKYRRQGISTLFQLLFLFIAETLENRHCRTAAHTDESATEIFTIAKTAYKESGHKLSADSASKKRIEIKSQGSTYACLTGAGSFSGSGSTIHCLHVSEMAKFRLNDAQDQRALNSMLNAVSQTGLETIVAIESSGQGPDGEFPDRCRKAAAGLGEYRVCFLKWTMDPTLRSKAPKTFVPSLGGDELILKHKHGADDEQLQWRRNKLMSDFLAFSKGQSLEDLFYNTPPEFAWEFPVTMEECFGQKAGRIFPTFGDPHMRKVAAEEFGPNSYQTRFIDWGGSENHPFVCLWLRIDPDQPPGFAVDPEACPNFCEQMRGFARDPRTGARIKDRDDGPDALRYGVSTKGIECFTYVYRELYIYNPVDALHPTVARRIHQMSGWTHPSGDPNDPDIAAYEPGPNADKFSWGRCKKDDRLNWSRYDEEINKEFQRAMEMGAGVADAAQYRCCLDFTRWGIPLVPHVKPPGPTKEGHVEDGIAMVNLLLVGNAIPQKKEEDKARERWAEIDKAFRAGDYVSDEDMEFWRMEQGIPDPGGNELVSAKSGWQAVISGEE